MNNHIKCHWLWQGYIVYWCCCLLVSEIYSVHVALQWLWILYFLPCIIIYMFMYHARNSYCTISWIIILYCWMPSWTVCMDWLYIFRAGVRSYIHINSMYLQVKLMYSMLMYLARNRAIYWIIVLNVICCGRDALCIDAAACWYPRHIACISGVLVVVSLVFSTCIIRHRSLYF